MIVTKTNSLHNNELFSWLTSPHVSLGCLGINEYVTLFISMGKTISPKPTYLLWCYVGRIKLGGGGKI